MGEYRKNNHVPGHLYAAGMVYMVTARTYRKYPVFNTPEKLGTLQGVIQERCKVAGWDLRAWVVLLDHYHFLARAPDDGNIPWLVKSIHSKSAILVNRMDDITGRRVWYNYWDTCIRSETDYYNRLRYIHLNPERHGVVKDFREYPYSSYKIFFESNDDIVQELNTASRSFDMDAEDDY